MSLIGLTAASMPAAGKKKLHAATRQISRQPFSRPTCEVFVKFSISLR
jgi:hypothetical protein